MANQLFLDQAPPTPPRTTQYGTRAIVTLAFVAMLGFLNANSFSPFLHEIARDLNTTVPQLGQLTTVLFLLGAAIGLVVGPFADARGTRRVLIVGLIAIVVSSGGIAAATSFAVLLIFCLVGVLSAGALGGVSLAIAATLFTGQAQRRAISWVTCGLAGGSILGIPVLTWIGSALDWRAAFITVACLAPIGLALAVTSLPNDRRQRRFKLAVILKAYIPLITSRRMRGLYTSSMLRSACWMGFLVYIGAFFADAHGFTTQDVGWLYTVGGTTYFLGTLTAGGRLSGRPLSAIFTLAMVVTGIGVAAILTLPIGAIPAISVLSIAAFPLGISGVCMSIMLATESPAGRATTMTLNASAMALGTALGAASGGLMIATGGYLALGIGLPLFALISAMMAIQRQAIVPQPQATASHGD